MNAIVKREGFFLGFLLSAKKKQRKCILKVITTQQLKVLVEIIYNVLHGFETVIDEKELQRLKTHKRVLRQIVAKRLSRAERIKLLSKHITIVIRLLHEIKRRITIQWRES